VSLDVPASDVFARRERVDGEFHSCGWRFADSIQFDFSRLFVWASGLHVERLKAILRTDRGNFLLNASDGVLSINDIGAHAENILEIIDATAIDAQRIENDLSAIRTDAMGKA
jgi:hypothetical protein